MANGVQSLLRREWGLRRDRAFGQLLGVVLRWRLSFVLSQNLRAHACAKRNAHSTELEAMDTSSHDQRPLEAIWPMNKMRRS